jgi:hypothetical protein
MGGLWGVIELEFGTLLHAAHIPFIGLIMMCFAIPLLVAGRMVTQMRGSCLLSALTASFIKLLFIGGIAIFTVIGIMIQAAILEGFLWKKSPAKTRYLLGSASSVLYSLFHPFLTLGILGGKDMMSIYLRIIQSGKDVLGLDIGFGGLLVIILVVAHFSVGFFVAWISYDLIAGLVARGVFQLPSVAKSDTSD